ncbi:glycosyltransferase family 2 protein [Bifidobacterium aesculapii]|uniref:glycosyltransferase family 2 protein n=1 Tax=Bifidobacterium aesculapii TaxID=1329411 RepID=UPI0009EB9697|nr:glycosyltransferase family 2 protein [Bifidobacterium aesculapii]
MTGDFEQSHGVTGGVRQVLAEALAARTHVRARGVEPSVAVVVTVEHDLRFLPDTLRSLLSQSVLPGVIVVADCTGGTAQPLRTSFDVTVTAHDPLMASAPGTVSVDVRLVRAQGASSFGDAVAKALDYARLDHTTRALWLLHDDSRPADGHCLERLVEAWRNTPGASLLGAKQLDWEAQRLHNVGAYASGHGVNTLVVDGEPDQEQYDARADVFAVSLAGALLPVDTYRAFGGIDAWFTTYAEGADLCRRICRGGGRVVVVPQAGIAHRRARFEGVRTADGLGLDDRNAVDPAMRVMSAWRHYRYTDIPMLRWPLVWLWSLIAAVGLALSRLVAKQPYEAWCELCMPWRAVASLPGAMRARRNVARGARVSHQRLALLTVSREQLAQWRERSRSLEDQRGVVLLGPLVRSHLRMRAVRRWGLAAAMAVAAFVAVLALDWSLFRETLGGGSLVSAQWLATDASLGQLAAAATTQWTWGVGVGAAVPPAPWLWVLLLVSLLTGGHVAAATSVMFFLAAPLAALSFWALAGVFTRSDAVRVIAGLLWVSFALALGLFTTADLAMLTVMVFLPGAFAFTFRAVGLYHTEDPVRPRPSVQASAAASLCYMPVVASEPQLLAPLVVTFLVFLLFVPRHRAMLLLMPLPAALLAAPTLVASVRYASRGEWRQLFGDMTVPVSSTDGRPAALNLTQVVIRAFGFDEDAGFDQFLQGGFATATLCMLVAVTVLAVVSLVLPFALRASRMMWVTIVTGGALSLASARVAVALDAEGPVAGSVLPGLVFAMLGALSCVCLMAGGAVRRFVALRTPGAAEGLGGRMRGRWAVVAGRVVLCVALCVGVVAWTGFSTARHPEGAVSVSGSGLPMIATDMLEGQPDQRILALDADSVASVSYAVMDTSRGDLIDSSPAWRARQVAGQKDSADIEIGALAARLLSNSDDEAVARLVALGFGGVFVVGGQSGSDQLATNITASDGTQAVVASADGTYYRLTAAEGRGVGVDTTHERAMSHSPWRYAWLVSLGVMSLLYVLVALPRRRRAHTPGERGDAVTDGDDPQMKGRGKEVTTA